MEGVCRSVYLKSGTINQIEINSDSPGPWVLLHCFWGLAMCWFAQTSTQPDGHLNQWSGQHKVRWISLLCNRMHWPKVTLSFVLSTDIFHHTVQNSITEPQSLACGLAPVIHRENIVDARNLAPSVQCYPAFQESLLNARTRTPWVLYFLEWKLNARQLIGLPDSPNSNFSPGTDRHRQVHIQAINVCSCHFSTP